MLRPVLIVLVVVLAAAWVALSARGSLSNSWSFTTPHRGEERMDSGYRTVPGSALPTDRQGRPAKPLIDQHQPAHVETATFALG